MTSLTKRKQLVNQLRKAHFPFGFQDNKPYNQSQYEKNYIQHNLQIKNHQSNKSRKTNIVIGDQNFKNSLNKTQFAQKYPEYLIHKKQQLLGSNNIQSKNIVFGYDNNQFKTNYNSDFNMKIQSQERVRPIDQRKPNIQLGDALTDFTSTYNKVFQQKQATPNIVHNNLQARKSNLILGNDNSHFKTQNNADFGNVSTTKYQVHKQNQNSSIDLGNDIVLYNSENKNNFCHKNGERQIVNKQTIKDFRSAHFKLGFPQKEEVFCSQNKANYDQKQIKLTNAQIKNQCNIHLNMDGNNYFQSSYGKSFENWGVLKKQQLNNKGRQDKVLIGTDYDPKTHFISQSKQNYNKKDIIKSNPIKPDAKLILGENQNNYITQNSLTYSNKFQQFKSTHLSSEQINKKKSVNVVTGFQNVLFNLSSSQYGKKLGNKGELPKSVLDGMKNTNIVLQTNPASIKTTQYKESFPFKKISE